MPPVEIPLPPLDASAITAVRDALGLTNTALGEALGVYRGTVGRWALGQQPPESPEMLRWALVGLAAADLLHPAGRVVTERRADRFREVASHVVPDA